MTLITEAIASTEAKITHLAHEIARRSRQMKSDGEDASEWTSLAAARRKTDAIEGHLRTIRSICNQLKSANTKLDKLREKKFNGITEVKA